VCIYQTGWGCRGAEDVIETGTRCPLTIKQFPDEPAEIVAEDRMGNQAVAEALAPRYPRFLRIDE
jgi:hypothetical protein